jgi:hypothetical protein
MMSPSLKKRERGEGERERRREGREVGRVSG